MGGFSHLLLPFSNLFMLRSLSVWSIHILIGWPRLSGKISFFGFFFLITILIYILCYKVFYMKYISDFNYLYPKGEKKLYTTFEVAVVVNWESMGPEVAHMLSLLLNSKVGSHSWGGSNIRSLSIALCCHCILLQSRECVHLYSKISYCLKRSSLH